MSAIIRDAVPADAVRMYEISFEVHGTSYERFVSPICMANFKRTYHPTVAAKRHFVHRMQQKIGDPRWRVYVAECQGAVVGYTLGVAIDETLFYKHGLFVESHFQGKGIGSMLLLASLKDTDGRTILLDVIKANSRAITLYERFGFRIKHESEKTFFGAPMWVMERAID